MLGALQRARGMAKKAAALVTEFNHLRQEAQLTATFFNRNAELGAAIVARLEELEGAMTTRRTIARAAAERASAGTQEEAHGLSVAKMWLSSIEDAVSLRTTVAGWTERSN